MALRHDPSHARSGLFSILSITRSLRAVILWYGPIPDLVQYVFTPGSALQAHPSDRRPAEAGVLHENRAIVSELLRPAQLDSELYEERGFVGSSTV